jgi:hypothetical protein
MTANFAAQEERVEAARYALLRRLAFAMRHHMVVHLQPIGMITEVLERRLQSAAPDLVQVHDSMAKVDMHARAAVQSSLEVVGWLAPEEGKLVALDAGVAECVDLLRSQLNFRGFTLIDEVGSQPVEVPRCALRAALPAVLLALTDHSPAPADIAVRASPGLREAQLSVRVVPREGSPGFNGPPHYRLLAWEDVEAIAKAEGVRLARGDGEVTISLPA